MSTATTPQPPPLDDALVDKALLEEESYTFDCKRLKDRLTKVLETVVAFANSDGGVIALGLEDPDKAQGRDRVYGIQENPMNWDELRRLMLSRITESGLLSWKPHEVGCTLRDGTIGSVVFLRIEKSTRIHSIVDDGTFRRLDKGNKILTAPEINDLSFARGTITAESQLESVDFDLLDTDYWRAYAQQRRLTRPSPRPCCTSALPSARATAGFCRSARRCCSSPRSRAGCWRARQPSASSTTVATRSKPIRTRICSSRRSPISGPVIRQIQDATEAVVRELASGIQMGPLGFEIVHRYPLRVIKEAITNAVIHRDYHLMTDVHIRIFSDRIEVESPGLFAGPVTAANIGRIGAFNRNPLLVSHLREFPNPPNLDAGEGVHMMFGTMRETGLYPPIYLTQPQIERQAVLVQSVQRESPLALGAGERLHRPAWFDRQCQRSANWWEAGTC